MQKFKKVVKKILAVGLCMTAGLCLTACSQSYPNLGSTKAQELRCQTYQMQMPESAKSSTSLSSDWYTFEKGGKTYGVIVSSNTNPDEIADYFKLENIKSYYLYDRANNLANILKDKAPASPTFSGEAKDETIEGHEAKVTSGKIQNEADSQKDPVDTEYNYVAIDFFADKENTTPVEVFVTSTESNENIKNVAIDIVKSIETVK